MSTLSQGEASLATANVAKWTTTDPNVSIIIYSIGARYLAHRIC
jgi:hypothetical protein